MENIGQPSAKLVTPDDARPVTVGNHSDAGKLLTEWLTAQVAVISVKAVGHRIVHGGPDCHETLVATDEVLADLHKLAAFDPAHMPSELELAAAGNYNRFHATLASNPDRIFSSG